MSRPGTVRPTLLEPAELRSRRQALKLTQQDLGKSLGVSANTVARWERRELGIADPGRALCVLAQLERAAVWTGQRNGNGRPPAHNLPAEITSFIGRERDVAALANLLSTTRLLTLVGIGGVGKTRLALRVAERALATYADGVWLVELANTSDPALVPHRVAECLGLHPEDGMPPVDTLLEVLGGRGLLLVLDNCEHLLQACAALVHYLLRACPGVSVLATSREPFGILGEHVWRVPSLTIPSATTAASVEALGHAESVQLFVSRAQAVQCDFELSDSTAHDVATICRRLDGIPLALELAAARLPTLGLSQVTARLEDRFRLLGVPARANPARQRTLRATLDWSFGMLSASERDLFTRLGVFAGGCDLEAVEAIAESADSAETFDQLVSKSLVQVDPQPDATQRYRLLETVRQYAQDYLTQTADGSRAHDLHAAYFSQLAERAEPSMQRPHAAHWLRRLELEYDNLRAALGWYLDKGQMESGLRLAAALRRFWTSRARATEGLRWLDAFDPHDSGVENRTLRARALVTTAACAYTTGDYSRARKLASAALPACRELGDQTQLAIAHNVLADVARETGDFDSGRGHAREVVSIGRRLGDDALVGLGLYGEAFMAAHLGELEHARSLAEAADACYVKAGYLWGRPAVQGLLGRVHFLLGDVNGAIEHTERAVALFAEDGPAAAYLDSGRASILSLLARAKAARGDTLGAREALRPSLGAAPRHRSVSVIARTLEAAMCLAIAENQPLGALRLAGAVERLREESRLPLPPAIREPTQQLLDQARAAVGVRAGRAARAAGRELSWEAAVAEGASAFAPDPAAEPRHRPLSSRQRDVLRLLAGGASNAEIAAKLVLSVRTVERHVAMLYARIGARGRVEAAAYAVRNGLA